MASGERQPLLRATAPTAASDERRPIKWLLATVLLTTFLSTVDLTVVATCIPTISSSLQTSDREAWIGTAYLWSNVTFTPLYGRLSDLIGRRNAYLQAVFLFTLGTFLCGVAPNFWFLVAARFIAGMGGGGMGTVASVIMSESVSPQDRAFYQGLTFTVFGAGTGLGGPIGGFLTQKFGWRAAFYTQVPVALLLFVLVHCNTSNQASTKAFDVRQVLQQVDFGGSLTLLISIGALLQVLAVGANDIPIREDPFTLAMVIVSPLFLGLFVYVETRIATRPVLPLSLLARRTPLCVGITAGVVAIINFNMMYHLPTFFEIVFAQSLSTAGAHLIPNSAAMAILPPLIGLLIRRTRRYKWAIVACACGPVIAMALLSTLSLESHWSIQWLSVLPMGAGFSGILTLTLIAMLNSVEKAEIATATGFIFVWRSIGQVFGVGISSAVYQSSLDHELKQSFDSAKIIAKLRRASKAIGTLNPHDQTVARLAFAKALRSTFLFGLAGACIVLITSLLIEDRQLEEHKPPSAVEGPEGSGDGHEGSSQAETGSDHGSTA